MDVTPLIPKGRYALNGYGAGGFKINNDVVQGSLVLLPERVLPWPHTSFDAEALPPLLELLEGVELLLVGTGKDMGYIPPQMRVAFKQKGISLDAMSTGAACRTYNVLLAEDRRVAAALIAV